MQTRILIVVGVIGLGLLSYGFSQGNKFIPLAGIFLVLIGFVGAYLSARGKKGMGFLRRL